MGSGQIDADFRQNPVVRRKWRLSQSFQRGPSVFAALVLKKMFFSKKQIASKEVKTTLHLTAI